MPFKNYHALTFFLFVLFLLLSKFLPPGTFRIGSRIKEPIPKEVKVLSFKTPADFLVIIVLNA